MRSNSLTLSNLKIYSAEGIIEHANLVIRDGVIAEIDSKKITKEVVTFPETFHLVPGFIDLHVHGTHGSDVMDGTADALQVISQNLAREGTTSFLATTMTASPDEIEKVLLNVRNFKQKSGAEILGVHLEGPFLSPKKVGAQSAEHLLLPDINYIEHWQKLSGDKIKLVTLAPELANSAEFIKYLQQKNIVASIGHTDATFDETKTAIAAGCKHATHLFNAMRGIHQREPGTVTAALLSDELTTELIVDGVHLHPAIVELVFKIKTKNQIALVTDSMRAKCMRAGIYDLGGQKVEVKEGSPRLADGTLAGSALKMATALQNMIQFTGCTLQDVLHMTSINPAKLLGIYNKKGSIAIGKDADLVVLNDKLQVVMTICRGEVVYDNIDNVVKVDE